MSCACEFYTSVTIGADGLGLIAYTGSSVGRLQVAHCSNIACTSSTTATLDKGDLGDWSSITTGADGLGLISYLDRGNGFQGSLKVAHCSNATCSSATSATLDSGDIGGFTSIAIGSDALGLVSYEAPQTRLGPLKVAHCSNVECSAAATSTVDTAGNISGTSVAVGADGLGLVSYWHYNQTSGGLEVVHCSNVFCIPYFRRR